MKACLVARSLINKTISRFLEEKKGICGPNLKDLDEQKLIWQG